MSNSYMISYRIQYEGLKGLKNTSSFHLHDSLFNYAVTGPIPSQVFKEGDGMYGVTPAGIAA